MNTQTHVLLACAVLVPPLAAVSAAFGQGANKRTPLTDSRRYKPALIFVCLAAILGALAPDASIYVMFVVAKLQGVPDSEIWGVWYFTEYWQQLSAISNSIPVYAVLALVSFFLGGRDLLNMMKGHGRLFLESHSDQSQNAASTASVGRLIGICLFAFSIAALLHVLTDLPLHHDDGRPHFWPFSDWIFRSPVSYWDPNHYGRVWSLIEVVLAIILIIVLWRRFSSRVVRGLLLFTALSYAIVTGYWWLAFS